MLDPAVKQFISMVLAFCFAGLGSGLFRFAHDATHAAEDARSVPLAKSDGTREPTPAPPPRHDESNCTVHSLLTAPLLNPAVVPLLVLTGLFVAFLTLLAPVPVSRRPLSRLDCRGPPACRK